jgi:hypothetical protein
VPWPSSAQKEPLLLLRAADQLMAQAHYRPVAGPPEEAMPPAGTFGTWGRATEEEDDEED